MNKADDRFPSIKTGEFWEELYSLDKAAIKSIKLVDSFQAYDGGTSLSWDISAGQNGSIMAYLLSDGTELIISGNGSGKIQAGSSMRRMFAEFTALERIDGLDILDTTNVTDMSYLFCHCVSLQELNLSAWDVSNVRNFRGTFCCGHNQIGDAALSRLNISGWDVSSAKDMAYMFYGCGRLKQLDVSNWNTGNVTNFRHTFADCFQLRELNVSRWNTKSVITLDGIFNDCRSLKQIDISDWDTSNCQEFDQMFDNCISLQKIVGIEKLDTTNGFSFEEMFFSCRSLKELDLSSINTRKVDGHEFTAYHSSIRAEANMKKMLVGCNHLKRLVIGTDLVFFHSENEDSVILNKLKEVGYLVLSPKTGSMIPFLRPKKDHAVFRQKDQYRKNDIVLYRSENDRRLIMHRIERPLADGFLIRGDSSHYSEYVPVKNIFAVACEIQRNNKVIKADSAQYKMLSFLSIGYNRIRYQYRNNDGIFWKVARKVRITLLKAKRRDRA